MSTHQYKYERVPGMKDRLSVTACRAYCNSLVFTHQITRDGRDFLALTQIEWPFDCLWGDAFCRDHRRYVHNIHIDERLDDVLGGRHLGASRDG